MRWIATLAGAGALLGLSGLAASAMPAAPAAGPAQVETVADGCGPGFFRGRRGFCRPIRRGPPGYGPPPGYYGGYGPPRGYGYGPPRAYGPPPGYGGPPPGFYRY